jgi:hypothetical protein
MVVVDAFSLFLLDVPSFISSRKNNEGSRWWKSSKTSLRKLVVGSIDEIFFLACGTVLAYFMFNIHVRTAQNL